MSQSNTYNCTLYGEAIFMEGSQEINLYRDPARTYPGDLVAFGSSASSEFPKTVTMVEQGGSGLSGSFYWKCPSGVTGLFRLDCK